MPLMLQRLREKVAHSKTVHQVKHHWLTIAFFGGFVVDNLTLNNVEQLFDVIILAVYVVLSMVGVLLLYASIAQKLPERINPYVRAYAPLIIQYAFGGLLSGMLIFYGRSGAWGQSWPFLLIILAVIYGNETIKDRVGRLVLNLALFFVGLFSYVVLIVPVFTGLMGPWVFVGSGLIALFITYVFVQVLFHIIPNFLTLHMRSVVFTIGAIFVILNTLYFTNVIPPIPLSLKEVGIFHSVVRFGNGDYQLKYEAGEWWQPLKDSDRVFHARPGDNVFCFAKVFAPTKISTKIVHVWEYKDPVTNTWVEKNNLSYEISGGRDGGYRGYTLIENYQPGKWRCSVETERGQLLGREYFTVERGAPENELTTRIE